MPGRIRIKFDKAIISNPDAKKLVDEHDSLPPGVHSMRLNALARSVVIEYSPQSIPPSLLEELMHAKDDARAAELLHELDTLLQNISSKEVH